jgi:ribosomal protein S12 methylthiotransferase
MASEPKICRYLDIPLQHINDSILKSMRRSTDKATTVKLLNDFRKKVPDVALRTTLLVGYPGETKKEFEELMEFVRITRFDRLGVFTYSAEEGTRAYSLKGTVSQKEKERRAEAIMELQQTISLELNQEKVGKVFRVLIDREDDDYFVGRTEYDSPEVDNEVFIKKDPVFQVGEFYDVKIISALEFELFGEIIS